MIQVHVNWYQLGALVVFVLLMWSAYWAWLAGELAGNGKRGLLRWLRSVGGVVLAGAVIGVLGGLLWAGWCWLGALP